MIGKVVKKRRGMSTQEYAAHASLSYAHVQKLKRQGRVVSYPDKSINAAATDERRLETTDPVRAGATTYLDGPPTPVPAADVDAVVETLRAEGIEVQGGMTFLEARTANEVLKAAERKIKVAVLERRYVEVDVVRKEFFRVARESRDAWLNWPNRVAALLAAEFNIDPGPFHAALEAEVRRHLQEIAGSEPKL